MNQLCVNLQIFLYIYTMKNLCSRIPVLMNSIQKIEKKHSYFTQMGISPFKKVCMPRICTIKSTVLSWQMISSFWTANYFVERILCSIKIKVDDSEIQNEDKCMSNNTPQKKHPEMKEVCSLSHQRKGEQRWRWQLPAQLWHI